MWPSTDDLDVVKTILEHSRPIDIFYGHIITFVAILTILYFTASPLFLPSLVLSVIYTTYLYYIVSQNEYRYLRGGGIYLKERDDLDSDDEN